MQKEDVASWSCGRPRATQGIDSTESLGHDLLDDELAANMETFQGRAFGLSMKSAFSSGDSDDDDVSRLALQFSFAALALTPSFSSFTLQASTNILHTVAITATYKLHHPHIIMQDLTHKQLATGSIEKFMSKVRVSWT